jgi:hypothetical protein
MLTFSPVHLALASVALQTNKQNPPAECWTHDLPQVCLHQFTIYIILRDYGAIHQKIRWVFYWLRLLYCSVEVSDTELLQKYQNFNRRCTSQVTLQICFSHNICNPSHYDRCSSKTSNWFSGHPWQARSTFQVSLCRELDHASIWLVLHFHKYLQQSQIQSVNTISKKCAVYGSRADRHHTYQRIRSALGISEGGTDWISCQNRDPNVCLR